MPLEQAIERMKSVFVDYRIVSYKEMNGLYIFEAYSPEYDKMPEPKKAMDPWYYVDKKTGKTGHYYPFRFKNPRKFFEMESVSI